MHPHNIADVLVFVVGYTYNTIVYIFVICVTYISSVLIQFRRHVV